MSANVISRMRWHDSALCEPIKAITHFKGLLDAALVAKGRGKATENQENWLQKHGFTNERPTGTGVNPDRYAEWVFGPFRKSEPHFGDVKLMGFPGWTAIGWNRRQYASVSSAEAAQKKLEIDQHTLDASNNDGYAAWLSPLPVLIAREGKHRVDLFRAHELEMLAWVRVDRYPSPTDLELCRVLGADDVWALRCKDRAYFPRGWKRKEAVVALPLPYLSLPFLRAYGVKETGLPCLPWKVSANFSDQTVLDRLRPSAWKKRILSDGYI